MKKLFRTAAELDVLPQMPQLRTFDYVIGAIGIVGALEMSGFSGGYLLVPSGYLFVFSMGIVLICLFLMGSKWLANILTPVDRQTYLFYIFTNSLPGLALLIKQILR